MFYVYYCVPACIFVFHIGKVQNVESPEGDNGFPLELELLVAQEYPVSTLNTESLLLNISFIRAHMDWRHAHVTNIS